MKIQVKGKNIEVTNALRETIEKKLSKVDRYFKSDVIAHVTLSVQKNNQIIEVTIPFNGVILRGEESSQDMYASIDKVSDILERQIRKQKTKLERRKTGDSLKFQAIESYKEVEEEESKIVKVKRFAVKPMSPEEAVLQMELVGHSFFAFRNADDEEINVVYKRKDGNYGLIVSEI